MKEKHLKILACLRKDARMALTKMSREIRVPVSTIFDNLKASEDDLITKHTSLLNFSKLGYNARANIMIKVNRSDKEALGSFLTAHDSINSAFKITNGYDYLVEGIFRDIRELENFKESLESKYDIQDTQTMYIVDDIKREEFLANPFLL